MGLGLTPPKSEHFDKFYSHVSADGNGEHSDLIWRNMLENPSLVQLDHRIMATTTFTAVMALWAYKRFSPAMIKYLPQPAKKAVHGVGGFAWRQVLRGIKPLRYLLPKTVASAHQAGSLALLSYCFVLGNRVWFPRAAARIIQDRARQSVSARTVRKVWEESRRMGSGDVSGMKEGAGGVVMAMAPIVAVAGFLATTPGAPEHVEMQEEKQEGDTEDKRTRYLQRQGMFKSVASKNDL